FIAWMPQSDLELMPAPNPYARIGEPRAASNDNRNAFLHTADEQFPFHSTALAVHLVRLYSILLGALTVLATYLLACEIFPNQPEIAWGASLLVAFLPQFLFISGAVSNDSLATLLSVAALWQMARIVHKGLKTTRALVLGLTIGAALLTKLNTIALLPLASVVILFVAWQKRDWRGLVANGVQVAAVAALVAGWWYWRNILLYGDPTTFARLAVLVGQRPRTMGLLRWTIAESEGLRLSAWGMFGWFNISAPPLFYQFFDVLAAVGLLGIIVALVTRRGVPAALAILPLWFGLVFFALWEYASNIITSQGRLLFPALAAYAVLWSWGINTLVPLRLRTWVLGGLASVLVVVAALTPGLVILPAYAPTLLAADAATPGMSPLGWQFENGIEWVSASLDRRSLYPGQPVDVTIYQRVPAGNIALPAVFIHLVNSAGSIVAQRDSLLASGNLHSLAAPAIVADSFRVSVPIGAPAPDAWRVEMGIYDPATGKRWQATDREGRPLGDTLILDTI
ncbi:MAG TPA: phospholipid carrier-dependent glycosyltransferase, partial [Anaerolineae bacterium]